MSDHNTYAPDGHDHTRRDPARSAADAAGGANAAAAGMSVGAERMALIRTRLAALEPDLLDIDDESHLHAGHAGAEGGASHFRVRIVSPRFAGLTPVARHRLVYHQLADLIPFPIHALALDTPAFKE